MDIGQHFEDESILDIFTCHVLSLEPFRCSCVQILCRRRAAMSGIILHLVALSYVHDGIVSKPILFIFHYTSSLMRVISSAIYLFVCTRQRENRNVPVVTRTCTMHPTVVHRRRQSAMGYVETVSETVKSIFHHPVSTVCTCAVANGLDADVGSESCDLLALLLLLFTAYILGFAPKIDVPILPTEQ